MSRVEEARRRAEGRLLQDDGAGPAATLDSAAAEPFLLEKYPRERLVTEQPKPVPAPPIAVLTPSPTSGDVGALDSSLAARLVGKPNTRPVVLEQYRRLASSLHELQLETG